MFLNVSESMLGIDAATEMIDASNLSTLACTLPSVNPLVKSCIGPKNFSVMSPSTPLSNIRPRKLVVYSM